MCILELALCPDDVVFNVVEGEVEPVEFIDVESPG